MDFKTQRIVRYWVPREGLPLQIDVERDPCEPESVLCPDPFFCFELVDRTTATFFWPDGSVGTSSKMETVSPLYYPGGDMVSAERMVDRYGGRHGHPGDGGHVALPDTNRLACGCGEVLAFTRIDEAGTPQRLFMFECPGGRCRNGYKEWPAYAPGDAP